MVVVYRGNSLSQALRSGLSISTNQQSNVGCSHQQISCCNKGAEKCDNVKIFEMEES